MPPSVDDLNSCFTNGYVLLQAAADGLFESYMIQSFEEKKLAKPAPGFDEVIWAMYACLKDRSDIAECVAIDEQFTDRIDRAMTDLSPATQGGGSGHLLPRKKRRKQQSPSLFSQNTKMILAGKRLELYTRDKTPLQKTSTLLIVLFKKTKRCSSILQKPNSTF